MPRSQRAEEVQILQFFETAPIEKAEMLFNIIKEKIRTRTGGTGASNGTHKKKVRPVASEPRPTATE